MFSCCAGYTVRIARSSDGSSRPRYVACFDARTALGEHSRICAAQRLRRLQRLALRHHLGDEAEFEPLACADAPAGQDHAHRLLARDHARQPVHAAAAGDQPDARLRQREQRVLRGDDDVAGERGLEPAAHRPAVHRGDDRLVEIEAMGDAGEAVRPVRAAAAGGLHLQVVAGRERALAGAGDDADPQIVARGELVPHGGEFVVRIGVQRVQDLGPVQRDDADPALVLHDAVLVCHADGHSPSPRGRGLGRGGWAAPTPSPQPPPARGGGVPGTPSETHPPITASLRSPPILPSSMPSQSASTSALCWPSSGAGLIGGVLPEKRTGQPLIV